MPHADPIREAERLFVICNACRYCEGYCAVFPAMERRLNFAEADIHYLANLCHNCAECYYACQYAPPHEFAVNVPKVLAEARAVTYQRYAWPGALAPWFRGRRLALTWMVAVVIFLLNVAAVNGKTFYAVVPHAAMVGVFLAIAALILAAHLAGFSGFWSEIEGRLGDVANAKALAAAVRDVLSLKNLGSGGAGCTYPNERHSQARRRIFHHFTFYGFLLCLASTTVAALYHFSGRIAPYPYISVPVLLGAAGGIGLLLGPAGLYALKMRRDPAIADPQQDGSDVGFLGLLFLTSLTGLLLLWLRETGSMGWLLLVHLGVVLALFLTLPYGKFVHGIYRAAALLKSSMEEIRSGK